MRIPSTPLPWASSDTHPEFVFHDDWGVIDVNKPVAHFVSADDAIFVIEAILLLERVRAELKELHAAFGAPGDYGYGTAKGEALFALYKSGNEIEQALASIIGEG